MTDKPDRQNFFPPSLVGAIVFFCPPLADGFPKPNYDDLFSTGAALNMAGGGDFSSPLIARQEFPDTSITFIRLFIPTHWRLG